jgi:hypothetical protein
MVRVTGATPKTSPFQSTTPPAGLVSMRISKGVGEGRGAGRSVMGSGFGAAQAARRRARAARSGFIGWWLVAGGW